MKSIIAACLLLLVWGCVKPWWEHRLYDDLKHARHGLVQPMTFEMRDKLGQGFALAALGGFRGVAANFAWMKAMVGWENADWTRVHTYVNLAAVLQPRVVYYWDFGSWQLAWNASLWCERHKVEPSVTRRMLQSQYWVLQGRDMLERGIEAIPEKPDLYLRMADLYWRRLGDFRKSSEYYLKATQLDDCPYYAIRFAGIALEEGGFNEDAYEYFKKLWNQPHEEIPSKRHWEVIERRIRGLEKKLNVPMEKRIFTK